MFIIAKSVLQRHKHFGQKECRMTARNGQGTYTGKSVKAVACRIRVPTECASNQNLMLSKKEKKI